MFCDARRSTVLLTALVLATACGDDVTVSDETSSTDTSGDGDPDTGDGDPDTGDGDPDTGDGDPDTGDGDPDTGDGDPDTGDGDPDTGDGAPDTDDGDPDELCGNGELDPGEECDGDDLDANSCLLRGYDGGTLTCSAECTFELNECCNDACTAAGESSCDGDTVMVCAVGDSGCLVWEVDTDCSATDEFCDATGDEAICAPFCVDQCEIEGDMQCGGDVIETCAVGLDGCLDWVSVEDCGAADQYCDGSGDVPECTCDDQCSSEGALQCAVDDSAVEICSLAANGCLGWTVETACDGNDLCELVEGAPECVAGPLEYCIPTYSSGCGLDDDIDSFIIVDADLNIVLEHLDTGCSPDAYGDFTDDPALTIALAPLSTYDFTITHNFSSQRVKIWIDFNLDGVFDSSELLYESPEGANPTIGQFSIPDVAPVTTRMRVMDRWSTTPTDACDPGGSFGETHDYTVVIE
jgi:hypothetical protein